MRGLTKYIDDMKSTSWNDCRNIPEWKTDLKALIRLRHIRNYLAHTEGAFHETVCTQTDIDLTQNFQQRIMNHSDPLAMLHQMSQSKKQTQEPDFCFLLSSTHPAKVVQSFHRKSNGLLICNYIMCPAYRTDFVRFFV